MAIKGEMPDRLPYAPRLDLWYSANSLAGTLPEKHKGRTQDEIARAEGWALHKVNPEYQNVRGPEDNLHWALGVLSFKESALRYQFSSDIDIKVKRAGERTRVTYHTPTGSVSTTIVYTEAMRKAGASNFWIEEHAIKGPQDYRVVGSIFENLELIPDFDDYRKWRNEIEEDGLAVTFGARAASPMHHIQKYLLDATEFYYHYHDYQKEMRTLAEFIEGFFEQTLEIIARCPGEAVYWGANFDDMITYPSFFAKEISPWVRKAAECLSAHGKFELCHCDGENLGLMDLIRDSGIHVAEAITPYAMTKVTIGEYYERWSDRLTLFGCIPECLLLEETATDEEFEAYLDHLFKAVAPGKRLILGIADSTPPKALFERLVRIGERVEREGRLPIEGGAARPISKTQLAEAKTRVAPKVADDEAFKVIQHDVLSGNHLAIKQHAQELLDKGVDANDVLHRGMISAMEAISERFRAREVFIPEVLLSARAMNEALLVLEPSLAGRKREVSGKVLMGTVQGDMHDIGKNMVVIMLRGLGFEIKDMGINVPRQRIVEQLSEWRPDILGLSALLTTTMPEMKKVIDSLEKRGLRNSVHVMVGGAPVNQKYATDIGADGYAPDASEAVTLAKRLMMEHRV